MFGRNSDQIAREFKKKLEEVNSLRKTISVKTAQHEVSAEDFLVSSVDDEEQSVSSALDRRIEDMSNDASDSDLNEEVESPYSDLEEQSDDQMDMLNDSYASSKVNFVLNGLGKIASDLRMNNERFAADMVEATAIKIKNEELQKIASKLQVAGELKKVASSLIDAGDDFAADLVNATINRILR